jgi:homoserine kinase
VSHEPSLQPGHEIVVPGSTSNLGPGFDALGLALDVTLKLRVASVGDGQPGQLTWRFAAPPGPSRAENAIERGFRTLSLACGRDPGELPALVVDVDSDIPMRAGLGSSAAAAVAGMRLYAAVVGPVSQQRLLDEAARLEGHPDNSSPSVLGGFVAACMGRDGRVTAVARPWPSALRIVVATPDATLETSVARRALPRDVPLQDAVANVQRTAVLVQAIGAGDTRALREAFRDRLHQPYRLSLVPGLERALAFEHPSLYGVFLSGAGPSIAAVVDDDGMAVRGMFEELYEELGLGARVRTVQVVQPFGDGG